MKNDKNIGTNPPTKAPNPGPPGASRKAKGLTATIDITNLDLFKRVTRLVTELVLDERVDESIREEYLDKLLEIYEENNRR